MRPMDIQTLLPKSTEVARSRHVEDKRSETFQQQFVAEESRRNLHRQRTVVALPRAQSTRIHRDGGSGRRNRHPGQEHHPDASPQCSPGANQARADEAQSSRPDGTGRLVNVVIWDSWGRA